jgi:hypothetical protein
MPLLRVHVVIQTREIRCSAVPDHILSGEEDVLASLATERIRNDGAFLVVQHDQGVGRMFGQEVRQEANPVISDFTAEEVDQIRGTADVKRWMVGRS